MHINGKQFSLLIPRLSPPPLVEVAFLVSTLHVFVLKTKCLSLGNQANIHSVEGYIVQNSEREVNMTLVNITCA